MTVTPLPARPPHARLTGPRRAPLHRRPPASAPAEVPSLTLSFVVTLTGDDRHSEAAEVLDTLRAVTARLTSAEVRITPPVTLATPPEAEPSAVADDETASPWSVPQQVLILADSREVRRDNEVIPFTRIEFDLLHFLAAHPRQVFTREQLLRHVWGFAHGGHRTVDVHIRRLRAKLGDREVATTVRGVGYRLHEGANLRVVRLTPGPTALPVDLAQRWS